MNKHLSVLLLIVGLLISSCAPKTHGFILKRGTNVSHWLSQNMRWGDARASFITEQDIANIASYGFDHIRLPIDEVQFWDNNGNKLDEAWQLLKNALDWSMKYDLRVVVDLHTIRSHNFNAVNAGMKNSLFEDPAEHQKLIDMWMQLSDFMQEYSTDYVAYEFMNEPVADDPEQWNVIIEKVHKALRAKEPKRVLVIGSNMWQSVDTFGDLRIPENDPYIILSFHFYHPMLLTHYKATWNEYRTYKGTVHYPGPMVTAEELESFSDEDKALVQEFTSVWDRDRLFKMISPAIECAKKHNLQLFCGEWGVYERAPREDAHAWYRDMISIFDEYNVAWTTWGYKGDFGFWKNDGSGFSDKEMLDVLMSGKPLQK